MIRVRTAGVRPVALLPILLFALLSLHPGRAFAQGGATGRLAGRITETSTGEPIPGAVVTIPVLRLGGQTDESGRYTINGIAPGTYQVRISHVGHQGATREGIVISAGATATLNASLKSEALKTKTVEVSGKRPLVEVKVPTSQHTLLAEDIENVAVQNVQDLIQRQAGVVQQDDGIHIRGGRSDEVVYYIEGVREKDALTGRQIQSAISPRAVQELNVISGGFEAEFNDALSGVVQVKMKEGSAQRYTSFASYASDHGFGSASQNTDIVDLQLGGPEPITAKLLPALGIHLPGEKTFYIDTGAELSDTYLPSIKDISPNLSLRSGYEDRIFGHTFRYGRFFTPREDNVWRFAANASWTPHPGRKFKMFLSKRIQINQGFGDATVGDLTRLSTNYPWRYKNALDRYTTQLSDQNTTSLTWTESFGKTGFHELRVARTFVGSQRDVQGKLWYRYEQGFADEAARVLYFYGSGDSTSEGPDWRNNYLLTTLLDYKVTRTWQPHHKVDAGMNVNFQDAQWARINCTCDTITNPYGESYDLFHVYPTTGNLYLQDHVDYQGFSGHVGMGYMFWFPGALADRVLADSTRTDIIPAIREAYYATTNSVFGHRMKSRWTPRFAISYPLTDHTKFYFNYGRYAQWPTYYYVYTRINPSRATQFPQKGDPALNPEVSVNYEVGTDHQFSSTMAFKIAVYNKDIYDQLTSRKITGPPGSPSYVQFFNQDYARGRGVELELRKRRTSYWSGALSYTYSQATGKGSDPNEILYARQSGDTLGFEEGQPREVDLWWNRPHKLTVNLDFRVNREDDPLKILGVTLPKEWGVNLFGTITSGIAYTPLLCTDTRNCKESSSKFSKNGPLENRWDLRADKNLGRTLRFTLEIYNLFDAKTPTRIDPVTGEGYVLGRGSTFIYPNSPTSVETIGSFTDPSNYKAPRSGRVGLEWSW
jgi:outer membrane receptor protein involved in Fe transport